MARFFFCLALLCAPVACSTVSARYLQPGYQARPTAPAAVMPIKHIAVLGWASPAQRALGDVLAAVAGDMVKLRKNYVVLAQQRAQQHWAEGCQGKVTGVLLVRALSCTGDAQKVGLHLAAELYRCDDGALLWRAESQARHASNDASLAELVAHHVSDLGSPATLYTAPAFTTLQDLVAALPDPQLSDAEVEEKIELGGRTSEIVAPGAQQAQGGKAAVYPKTALQGRLVHP